MATSHFLIYKTLLVLYPFLLYIVVNIFFFRYSGDTSVKRIIVLAHAWCRNIQQIVELKKKITVQLKTISTFLTKSDRLLFPLESVKGSIADWGRLLHSLIVSGKNNG